MWERFFFKLSPKRIYESVSQISYDDRVNWTWICNIQAEGEQKIGEQDHQQYLREWTGKILMSQSIERSIRSLFYSFYWFTSTSRNGENMHKVFQHELSSIAD